LTLVIAVAVAAVPIAELFNPANADAHCDRAEVIDATGHMLVIFSPQVVLYGLSVVLYGLLQAYRRFTGPTLGPPSPASWSSRPAWPSSR
jgi:putative peptidoglycan lipid II flippase